MSTVAELKQILKEDVAGRNLYHHLTETLMKIALDRPSNVFDIFEMISSEAKINPLDPNPPAGKSVLSSSQELVLQRLWVDKCSALLKVPEERPEDSSVKFPDLMDEANLVAWAGISLGQFDTYKLYLSVRKLAESLPAETERLRFFGRISTLSKPYYIIEGINSEDDEGADHSKQESNKGANKYSYWVSQSVELGDWRKLPNVTSAQIVAARLFKRFLTGNLEDGVPSYPIFPGTETNLLRAQIARIVGCTSVSPAGFFEVDEDQEVPTVKLVEPESIAEAFPKPSRELIEADSWRHHEIDLNVLGRVTALPETLDENGEPAVPEEGTEDIEITPPLDSLKSESWTFRVCPGGAGSADGSIVVARSLVWPGAVAIAAGKRFLNIYFGNGVVYDKNSYTPPLPPSILSEWSPPSNGEEGDTLPLIEQPDIRMDPTPQEAEPEEGDA